MKNEWGKGNKRCGIHLRSENAEDIDGETIKRNLFAEN